MSARDRRATLLVQYLAIALAGPVVAIGVQVIHDRETPGDPRNPVPVTWALGIVWMLIWLAAAIRELRGGGDD